MSCSAVCGKDTVRCVSKNLPDMWFQLELLHHVHIQPSHYTLKHYSSWDTEALRNWVLEGSRDGEVWTCLRQHVNDGALNAAGATHTWLIRSKKSYSYFRIRATGRNSNHNLFLACSGKTLITLSNNPI